MSRFFNTTGLCNPKDHYMVDPFRGLYDDYAWVIDREQCIIHVLEERIGREVKILEDGREIIVLTM